MIFCMFEQTEKEYYKNDIQMLRITFISSGFSNNSEVMASELIENLEDMFSC